MGFGRVKASNLRVKEAKNVFDIKQKRDKHPDSIYPGCLSLFENVVIEAGRS